MLKPFTQADSTPARNYEGTGAIVRLPAERVRTAPMLTEGVVFGAAQ